MIWEPPVGIEKGAGAFSEMRRPLLGLCFRLILYQSDPVERSLSGIEHISVQTIHCLFYKRKREGQVHADGIWAVEGPSVLPEDALADPGGKQLVHGLSMLPAPLGAIQKQHIGALGFCQSHALKMGSDIVVSIGYIFRQYLAELIHPLVAFRLIGADERVHAHDIHTVIMGKTGFLFYPVPYPFIVYDVIAAYQTCQVKGLAGGVEGSGTHPGILAYRLGRDVAMTIQDKV